MGDNYTIGFRYAKIRMPVTLFNFNILASIETHGNFRPDIELHENLIFPAVNYLEIGMHIEIRVTIDCVAGNVIFYEDFIIVDRPSAIVNTIPRRAAVSVVARGNTSWITGSPLSYLGACPSRHSETRPNVT